MNCTNCECDAKQPCCDVPNGKEYKVVAKIKQDYWVEDIKRYVIPKLYFINIGPVATIVEPEPYDKPFVCESKNVEFRINRMYSIVDVFGFSAFESVTVSTI